MHGGWKSKEDLKGFKAKYGGENLKKYALLDQPRSAFGFSVCALSILSPYLHTAFSFLYMFVLWHLHAHFQKKKKHSFCILCSCIYYCDSGFSPENLEKSRKTHFFAWWMKKTMVCLLGFAGKALWIIPVRPELWLMSMEKKGLGNGRTCQKRYKFVRNLFWVTKLLHKFQSFKLLGKLVARGGCLLPNWSFQWTATMNWLFAGGGRGRFMEAWEVPWPWHEDPLSFGCSWCVNFILVGIDDGFIMGLEGYFPFSL